MMRNQILLALLMVAVSDSAISATFDSKQLKTCGSIRAEIKNQFGISAVIASQQTSPLIALFNCGGSIWEQGRNN